MRSGKSQQGPTIGHRVEINAVAGQRIHHIQQLIAVLADRPETAPARHPGADAARRTEFGAAGGGHRPHAHIALLKETAHLTDRLAGGELGIGDKTFYLGDRALAFPFGRTGVADTLAGQHRRPAFQQAR